jgi:hypothetical protein
MLELSSAANLDGRNTTPANVPRADNYARNSTPHRFAWQTLTAGFECPVTPMLILRDSLAGDIRLEGMTS